MLVPLKVIVLIANVLSSIGKNVSIIGAMTLEEGFLTGLSFDGGTRRGYFFVVY